MHQHLVTRVTGASRQSCPIKIFVPTTANMQLWQHRLILINQYYRSKVEFTDVVFNINLPATFLAMHCRCCYHTDPAVPTSKAAAPAQSNHCPTADQHSRSTRH